MEKKITSKSLELAGRTLTLEVGRLAEQTNSSVLARYGDTMVLVTVVANKEKQGAGFVPLSVDYVERLYAGGIIKGSRWVKREGRPTDEATLACRLIDRSLRPLFPKDFFDEVQVAVTLLSTDGENDHDLLALIAASAALHISDVPWDGPIAAVKVGFISEGQEGNNANGPVVNPLLSEMVYSDLDLVVSSTKDRVVMIEAGAKQLPDNQVVEAIAVAHKETKAINDFIEDFRKEVGKDKYVYKTTKELPELHTEVEKFAKENLDNKTITRSVLAKGEGETGYGIFLTKLIELFAEKYSKEDIERELSKVWKKKIQEITLSGKRVDGRDYDQVRPINVETGLLPRTHGSGLFARGITQVLSVATLANPSLEQWIETAEGMTEKRYLHHYSMPPYATGETGRMGSPGRREIGHGALAEKAITPVIPSQADFPYTIRVVSEVMSSDGSTSMASTCGSTIALMDAGVPILAPVAGISIGLMAKNDKDYILLTDIRGIEDFNGNMDFKVAGTDSGVTAVQLDMKLTENVHGLTIEMIKETFAKAKTARQEILKKMLAVIPESRKGVSQYAPKVVTLKVPVEKIGEVIGPGGKNIRNIIATTASQVDIADDGTVTISSIDADAVQKAVDWVSGMTREVKPGEKFDGTVMRIMPFGAFVEYLPGKEGLVHVSMMTNQFLSDPNQLVKVGDKVKVWVTEVDDMGRTNLSMLFDENGMPVAKARPPRPERPGGFGGPSRGGFGGPRRPGGFRH